MRNVHIADDRVIDCSFGWRDADSFVHGDFQAVGPESDLCMSYKYGQFNMMDYVIYPDGRMLCYW